MLAYMPDLPMGVFMMKTSVSFFAFICFVSASVPALAAAATPEEAQRLTGVFQTYLGREPGVVMVTPAGEAYDVKIDFAPLIAKFKQPNFSAEVSPVVMKLTDQGGGKWLVTQDSPYSIAVGVRGGWTVTARIGSMKATSVFDENLAAFVSSTTDFTDISLNEIISTPESGYTQVAYHIGSLRYESSATASETDGVDSSTHATLTGFVERVTVRGLPGVLVPTDIKVTADAAESNMSFKGLRNRSLYHLIGWFVAHPSQETIKTNAAELKAILSASLPLFENLSGKGTYRNISITTPMGPVGLASVGYDINLNGIVADGSFHESLTFDGLTLPPGFVPSFATDLIPHSFTLDFKIAEFNLADPAKMLLEIMNFNESKPLTPEENAKLLTALLPKGAVEISMGPSKVTAKLYDVDFEGRMTAGPVGVPLGAATIRAKGLDDVMKALQAAPPEMIGNALPAIIAAKGMAKTEADGSLSWKIENTISGGVLVNGIDVSKMGGGG